MASDDRNQAAGARLRRAGSPLARRRGRPANPAVEFYRGALTAGERILLDEAAEIEGLDGEIASLRTKLHTAIKDHPEDLPLMLHGVGLLVKAVSARYRLSKTSQQDLAASIAAVIRGVGGQLMPEAFNDG